MPLDSLRHIDGFLLDLNGVVYDYSHDADTYVPIPGAVETINLLKEKKIPYRFTTNTTIRSLATLHRKLLDMGLPIEKEKIFTVTKSAAAYLRRKGNPSLYLVVNEDTAQDFAEFPRSKENPEVIVVGEVGDIWTYEMLNEMFHLMLDGTELVALHKGKFWQSGGKLRLGIGAFISGLEYATGKEAVVIGKPSPAFFRAPVDDMNLPPERVAMIGDDIESDVGAAQRVGMKGILVKTGKYRERLVAASSVTPDLVIDSVAELKNYL